MSAVFLLKWNCEKRKHTKSYLKGTAVNVAHLWYELKTTVHGAELNKQCVCHCDFLRRVCHCDSSGMNLSAVWGVHYAGVPYSPGLPVFMPPPGMRTETRGAQKPLMMLRTGPRTVKTGTFDWELDAQLNLLVVTMAVFPLQPQAHPGWGALLGTVLRQADVLSGREELIPTVSPHRVQRGEHALLASVWRVQERDE